MHVTARGLCKMKGLKVCNQEPWKIIALRIRLIFSSLQVVSVSGDQVRSRTTWRLGNNSRLQLVKLV